MSRCALSKSRMSYRRYVQKRRKLLGQLLNQVNFTVKMKNFGSECTAFRLAGREMRKKQRQRTRGCGGPDDEAQRRVLERYGYLQAIEG